MLMENPCVVNVCQGETIKLKIDECKIKCIKWKLSRDNGLTYNLIEDECSSCLEVDGTILSNCYLYKVVYIDKCCCKHKKVFKLCVDFLTISPQPKSVCIDVPSEQNPVTVEFISGYKNNPDCGNIVKCSWEVMIKDTWVPVVPGVDTEIIEVGNICKLILKDIMNDDLNGNMYRAIFESECGKVISKIAGLAIGPLMLKVLNELSADFVLDNGWFEDSNNYKTTFATGGNGVFSVDSVEKTINADGVYYLELIHEHNFEIEINGGNVKLSVNSGNFDLVNPFTSGNYNGVMGGVNLKDEAIWTGGFDVPSIATLGDFKKGDKIQLRFDAGWNQDESDNLWSIFAIKVSCVNPN